MNDNQYIFVTGGLGFIGSHVVVKLLELNLKVIIYDNLANSNINVVDKIRSIVPTILANNFIFIKGDVRDTEHLNQVFSTYPIFAVMHFAALKSVNESEIYPELYNDVNVNGTKVLLNIMQKYKCTNFIYSSSATVYGDSEPPVTETSDVGQGLSCNYAKNKYDVEMYLKNNYNKIFVGWNIVILRYFNPIGAHPSGLIGEDPNDVPNNIFPYLLRVAKWTNDQQDSNSHNPYKIFTVFGDDYNTRDGTCIRDYIHVQDLARAHVVVLSDKMLTKTWPQLYIYNIGTGFGSTVKELINALNIALIVKGKLPINYCIGPRRVGDIAVSYANVDTAYNEIGFKTEYSVQKMCEDGLTFIGL